jgi:predicted GIY-YIG superfamily endonuclease
MTNRSKTLYTGVTGDLEKRVFEHKQGIKGEFAARYKIDRLAYFERFGDIHAAIAREKQIKANQKDRVDRIHESRMERPERGVVPPASVSA